MKIDLDNKELGRIVVQRAQAYALEHCSQPLATIQRAKKKWIFELIITQMLAEATGNTAQTKETIQ